MTSTITSLISRLGKSTSDYFGGDLKAPGGSTQLGWIAIGAAVGATLFVLENRKNPYDPHDRSAIFNELGKNTISLVGGAATGGMVGAFAPFTLPALVTLGAISATDSLRK